MLLFFLTCIFTSVQNLGLHYSNSIFLSLLLPVSGCLWNAITTCFLSKLPNLSHFLTVFSSTFQQEVKICWSFCTCVQPQVTAWELAQGNYSFTSGSRIVWKRGSFSSRLRQHKKTFIVKLLQNPNDCSNMWASTCDLEQNISSFDKSSRSCLFFPGSIFR